MSGAPSRLKFAPGLLRSNAGCEPSEVEGFRMKLTSIARWQWLVASVLFWFSGGAACQGEGPVAGLSRATIGHAVPAMRLVWAQISLALLQGIVLIALVTFTTIIVLSVMSMMVIQSMLARGGMGKRFLAAAAMRISLVFSHALRAVAQISCVLIAFELLAAAFYPSFHEWLFYAVPMLFALLLEAATSFSIVTKQDELWLQIAVSEARYKLLFERSLLGAYQATLDGRILDCNFSFCQIVGYASREEALRNGVRVDYFNAADQDRINTWLQARKKLTNFEMCLRRKDGGTAWVLNSATLAKSEQGNELLIKGTMLDISELRMGLPAWVRKMARILAAVRWSFGEASQI